MSLQTIYFQPASASLGSANIQATAGNTRLEMLNQLSTQVVGYYPMEEASGPLIDMSENRLDASLLESAGVNTGYQATGAFGTYGHDFVNSTEQLYITNGQAWSDLQARTKDKMSFEYRAVIEDASFSPNTLGTGGEWVSYGDTRKRTAFGYLFSTGQVRFQVSEDGSSADTITHTSVPTQTVSHIYGAYDSSSSTFYLAVDGSMTSLTTSVASLYSDNNVPLGIGGLQSEISPLRLWSYGMDEYIIRDSIPYTANFTPTVSAMIVYNQSSAFGDIIYDAGSSTAVWDMSSWSMQENTIDSDRHVQGSVAYQYGADDAATPALNGSDLTEASLQAEADVTGQYMRLRVALLSSGGTWQASWNGGAVDVNAPPSGSPTTNPSIRVVSNEDGTSAQVSMNSEPADANYAKTLLMQLDEDVGYTTAVASMPAGTLSTSVTGLTSGSYVSFIGVAVGVGGIFSKPSNDVSVYVSPYQGISTKLANTIKTELLGNATVTGAVSNRVYVVRDADYQPEQAEFPCITIFPSNVDHEHLAEGDTDADRLSTVEFDIYAWQDILSEDALTESLLGDTGTDQKGALEIARDVMAVVDDNTFSNLAMHSEVLDAFPAEDFTVGSDPEQGFNVGRRGFVYQVKALNTL